VVLVLCHSLENCFSNGGLLIQIQRLFFYYFASLKEKLMKEELFDTEEDPLFCFVFVLFLIF